MAYTLGEAAKAVGKDPATISRALKKGTISAEKNAHGQWQIEPVELHRVYPPVQETQDAQGVASKLNASGRNTELESENKLLRASVESANDRILALEEERDRWHQAFEKQQELAANTQRLLEDQTKKAAEKAVEPPKSFWARLMGRAA